MVGVTGSTGKTSTKDILGALLRRRLRTVASHANFNTEIGLPLTLCRVEADTEAVVCELGMRGMGQVAYLAEIARPDVAVITSVGPGAPRARRDGRGGRRGEGRDPAAARPDETAVVPHAEPLLDALPARCAARA